MHNQKVTLNGEPGVGTTTIGQVLAKMLRAPFFSGGNLMRHLCDGVGVTDAQFKEMRKSDPRWDQALDAKQRELGHLPGPLVLESRLGWHFIPHSYKVLVRCERSVRIHRLHERARRNGSKESRGDVALREHARSASDQELYRTLYGIADVFDPGRYDLIVNSTELNANCCAQLILQHLSADCMTA